MEPTGTHVDAIGIGDNVWVTQGKTDHMANFFGEPRWVVPDDSDSENEDDETTENNKKEDLEVLIRWATTGTRGYVSASSVRPVVLGQRRRRQAINHFHAAPSQRPVSNQSRKRKTQAATGDSQPQQNRRSNKASRSKQIPRMDEFKDDREEKPKRKKKEAEGSKKESKPTKGAEESKKEFKPRKEAEESKNESKPTKTAEEPASDAKDGSGSVVPDTDKTNKDSAQPPAKLELPTQEEIWKYPERRQQRNEKKERLDKLARKRKRQIEERDTIDAGAGAGADNDDDDDENTNNDDHKKMARKRKRHTEERQASDADNDDDAVVDAHKDDGDTDTKIPARKHKRQPEERGASDANADADASKDDGDTDNKKPARKQPEERGASGAVDDNDGGDTNRNSNEDSDASPKPSELVTSDSTATETAQDPKNQQSLGRRISNSDVDNDNDESMGDGGEKKQPSELEDPNHVIDQGFRWEWETSKITKDTSKLPDFPEPKNCTDRPIPGNYGKRLPQSWHEAYAMLVEFERKNGGREDPSAHPLLGEVVARLRSEHSRFLRNPLYRRNKDENPMRDMTRLDSTRTDKLKKLGFPWDGDSASSNSENENEDDERFLKGDSGKDSDHSENSVTSLDDTDGSAESQGNELDDEDSSSTSSDDDDIDENLLKIHKGAHAKDDEILIVSSLTDIKLDNTFRINDELVAAHKPTFPVELYRLLRLSSLHPNLGLSKMIRWAKDGNGFLIIDEARFAKKIVSTTSKMTKISSFKTTLNKFKFREVTNGRSKHGLLYREFQHTSIAKAKKAKNPSLRRFYRGAPLSVLFSILHRSGNAVHEQNFEDDEKKGIGNARSIRKRELDHGVTEDGNSDGNDRDAKKHAMRKQHAELPMSRGRDRERRRTSDGCLLPKDGAEQLLLEDGTYDKPRGAQPNGLKWDKIRGLWAPPHLLTKVPDNEPDASNEPDERKRYGQPSRERSTSDGCPLPKSEPLRLEDGTYKKPSGHQPKGLEWDNVRGLWVPEPESLWLSEVRRKRKLGGGSWERYTSDGCLLPKSEPMRLEDGTYKKPRGHQPKGLEWDNVRGLWVPESESLRLSEVAKKGKSGGGSRERYTSDGCLLPKSEPVRLEDGTYKKPKGYQPKDLKWDKVQGLWVPEPESLRLSEVAKERKLGGDSRERYTSDGCLLPKRKPLRLEDGTYKKPQGHQPKDLEWDDVRGLWVPEGMKKGKLGSKSSVSSSSEEGTMIIKASKAKLFHHSSSILHTYLSSKKKKRRHCSHYHSQTFQARTKSNPSGIVKHKINLNNWRKIEKLMRRSTPQQKNVTVPVAPTVTSKALDDEGEVRFI
jgi:hypothetical protein